MIDGLPGISHVAANDISAPIEELPPFADLVVDELLFGERPNAKEGLGVADIVEMFERKTPRDFEIQMLALLNRPDARPVLPTIKCPTLVLTGRDDVWSTPARHEEMAAAIPGAKLLLVPQCGHMSTMERPAEVTAAMRTWLAPSTSA